MGSCRACVILPGPMPKTYVTLVLNAIIRHRLGNSDQPVILRVILAPAQPVWQPLFLIAACLDYCLNSMMVTPAILDHFKRIHPRLS